MGSVEKYETQSGPRYSVRYRKPDNSQGKKRGFTRKKDAELYLALVETSKARGEFIDARDTQATIGTLGTEWLANQVQLKPSSLRSIDSAWRVHVLMNWENVPIGKVRHSDVQAWVTRLAAKRGPTTVHRAYGVLAAILDVAVKDRRLTSNPSRGASLPRKSKRSHTYLAREQVEALALAAGDRRPLVLVLAYCGLRWGEATGLRVRDLDMLRRRINVRVNAVEVGSELIVGTPKTHKVRSVPVIASLLPILAQACEGKGPDDLVFWSALGTHVRRAHNRSGWFAQPVRLVRASGPGLRRATAHAA